MLCGVEWLEWEVSILLSGVDFGGSILVIYSLVGMGRYVYCCWNVRREVGVIKSFIGILKLWFEGRYIMVLLIILGICYFVFVLFMRLKL